MQFELTTDQIPRPKFLLGALFITPSIRNDVPHEEIVGILRRHSQCDWGEVSDEDKRANDASLRNGTRLLSAYTSTTGIRIWVLTEADRSITTILLPEEH